MRIRAGRRRRPAPEAYAAAGQDGEAASREGAAGQAAAADTTADQTTADETTAELEVGYWRTYHQRMASIGFLAMARQFPRLVAQAIRLGSQASRRDIWAAIVGSSSCSYSS